MQTINFLEILSFTSNVVTVLMFLYNLKKIKVQPILSSPYTKAIIISISFTLLVFFVIKPLFFSTNVKPDIIANVVHDTVLIEKNNIPTPKKYKEEQLTQDAISNKNPSKYPSKPKTDSSKPKYDLRGSQFQGPIQLGDNNTQNNIGDLPRIIAPSNFNTFFNQVTDKNVRIGVDFVGLSANKEMINVKEQILKILVDNGYKNIGYSSGYRVLNPPPSDIVIQLEKDGSYIFCIPPK